MSAPIPALPILALQDATLVYETNREAAFQNLDFALHAGERLGIVGDNGSGKTSLLMALTGLRPLASGRLLFRGRPVQGRKDLRALRRSVGLVFQNSDDQLFSPTVLEDVAFGPLNLGCSNEEALQKAQAILTKLGIRHLAEYSPHQLSGGQKRLVALATAIVMEPEVLLLDEPTNGLDAAGRATLAEVLRHEERTLVVVSHEPCFLEQVVSRCLQMDGGRFVDTPR